MMTDDPRPGGSFSAHKRSGLEKHRFAQARPAIRRGFQYIPAGRRFSNPAAPFAQTGRTRRNDTLSCRDTCAQRGVRDTSRSGDMQVRQPVQPVNSFGYVWGRYLRCWPRPGFRVTKGGLIFAQSSSILNFHFFNNFAGNSCVNRSMSRHLTIRRGFPLVQPRSHDRVTGWISRSFRRNRIAVGLRRLT